MSRRSPKLAKPSESVFDDVKATEDGDSVRFERPGPFGVYRWQTQKDGTGRNGAGGLGPGTGSYRTQTGLANTCASSSTFGSPRSGLPWPPSFWARRLRRIFVPPPAPPATTAGSGDRAQPQAAPQAHSRRPAPAAQPGRRSGAARQQLASERPFCLGDVSLTEMIDILAKMLKINYILDPRVKGSVTLYTYGEVKPVDLMPLLQTILRVNGAAMVQVGDLYRIVPIDTISNLPLDPMMNADPKTLPDDERMVLNLIFLKYATADRNGQAAQAVPAAKARQLTPYEPANLLILQDNAAA